MRERETFFTADTIVCCGIGRGRRAYLLSTAGRGRRVGCLLCSSTGLRVCRSKPLARRSRIVANSNPRMQREYTARIQSTQLALVGEAAALLPCAAAPGSLASIAGRFTTEGNSPTHCSGHAQEAYGETRMSLLDLASPKPTRAVPSRNKLVIHNITHYSPGTRSRLRGVVASTPRAARRLPARGSAH